MATIGRRRLCLWVNGPIGLACFQFSATSTTFRNFFFFGLFPPSSKPRQGVMRGTVPCSGGQAGTQGSTDQPRRGQVPPDIDGTWAAQSAQAPRWAGWDGQICAVSCSVAEMQFPPKWINWPRRKRGPSCPPPSRSRTRKRFEWTKRDDMLCKKSHTTSYSRRRAAPNRSCSPSFTFAVSFFQAPTSWTGTNIPAISDLVRNSRFRPRLKL